MVMIKRGVENLEPISVAAGAADSDPSYYDVVPKEPTPLLGSWADVWSSRQASEIILDDAEKDGKSAAAPISADDELPQQQQQHKLIAPHNSDASAGEMSPAASFSSDASAGAPLDETCGAPHAHEHARHVYRHNPYGLSGTAARTDIFVCTCAACVTANLEAHAEIARRHALARVPPYALSGMATEDAYSQQHVNHQHALGTVEPPSPIKLGASADSALAASTNATPTPTADNEEPQRIAYTPSFRAAQQQQQQQQQQRGGFLTHSHVPPPPPHAPRAEVVAYPTSRASAAAAAAGYEAPAMPAAIAPHMLSAFMPPPPPSTLTAAVLERDGTTHARHLVEYVALRWHAKVCATQLYFVAPEDTCPEPAGRDFDTWLQECADWWFRNFEFAQMKPTVYAAAHGYGGYGSAAPAYDPSAYDASGYYNAGGQPASMQEIW